MKPIVPSPKPRRAPAALNSVTPVPRDRCARTCRNCTVSPALVSGGALRRIESLSAAALPDLGEEGGPRRTALGFQAEAIRALAVGKRERRKTMTRYKGVPRW